MKANCIRTKFSESIESQWHSNIAYWFQQNLLNHLKANWFQPKLFEWNESQVHSNKANWIEWKPTAFKQC